MTVNRTERTVPVPRRRSLVRSTSGNTLALMAAGMIPLAGMTGSAIDMSRIYMVKVRLQQACDAGALAGRRFMSGTTLDSAAETEARKFFNVNFPAGWMGTTGVAFTPDETADGQVHATATATVPMALMQMFGMQPIALDVECDAKYEISNTDVMFVLDVTGSMNCAASDTPSTCGNNSGVEKSNARIRALRTAVVDFYDTMDTAVDDSARLRIGFVPYSSTVNVGGLLPASYLRDRWSYQSRVASFRTPQYVGTPGSPIEQVVQIYNSGVDISRSDCAKYGQRISFSGYSGGDNPERVSGGPPPADTIDYTYSNDTSDGVDWGYPGAPDTSGTKRSCRRTRTKHPTSYQTRYVFTNWIYRREEYDTSRFKAGQSVTLAPGHEGYVTTPGDYNAQALVTAPGATGFSTISSTWNGCLEERDTVSVASFSPIPSGAIDLDIDRLPDSDASRWRPAWPDVVYGRGSRADGVTTTSDSLSSNLASTSYSHATSSDSYDERSFIACPIAARNLAEMTRAEVENYVSAANGFRAIGGTYHDFGMLWGARLISPTGIFSANNATAPNGKPISRHIIFMTDGDMSPHPSIYGLYGLEWLDQRIGGIASPGASYLKGRHNARFTAICNAARAKNITIWVVAYAQQMTDELKACADPGKAFYASSDDELKAQFKQIAAHIAQLRLSR